MDTTGWAKEQPERRLQHFEPLDDYRHAKVLIGIEEHAAVPEGFKDRPVIDHFAKEMGFAPSYMDAVKPRLTDVALRVATMDKCGMAAMCISLAEPGAQGFTSDETERAADFSRRANEFVKEAYCDAYPGRFFGMATVPSGDGEAAAKELEYAVKQLGFVGCLINGYTNDAKSPWDNVYLDSPKLRPFWKKVSELDVPVFLHPRAPDAAFDPLGKQYPGLRAPTWGFTRETQEHAIRLMLSGLFDEYPNIKVVLGHLGEGLSFVLPRLDHRMRIMAPGTHGPHKKTLCHYFQNNFIPLTSGHFTTTSLQQLTAEVGTNNVCFSVDYPFESIEEHVDWWRTVPVGEQVWRDMSYRNAIKAFKLPLNFD